MMAKATTYEAPEAVASAPPSAAPVAAAPRVTAPTAPIAPKILSTLERAVASVGLELADVKSYSEAGPTATIFTHRGQTFVANIGQRVESEIEAALVAQGVTMVSVRSIQRDMLKGEAHVYVRGRSGFIVVPIAKAVK